MGKSGGELQQEDIRLLRRELEAKQEKLNELRRATHELSTTWVLPGPRPPASAVTALDGRLPPLRAGAVLDTGEIDTRCPLLTPIHAGWSSWRRPAGTVTP